MNSNNVVSRRSFIRKMITIPSIAICASAIPSCTKNSFHKFRMSEELDDIRPLANFITRNSLTLEDEVNDIVMWSQKNLVHYNLTYNESNCYGSDGSRNDRRDVSIHSVFEHRVVGCHLAVAVMAAMLNSIGIYADYLLDRDLESDTDKGGHAILTIPDYTVIDQFNRLHHGGYVHGDAILFSAFNRIDELMYSREGLLDWLRNDGCSFDICPESYAGGLHDRDNDSLVLNHCWLFPNDPTREWERIQRFLSEYNPRLGNFNDEGDQEIFTDPYPIQTLDEIYSNIF